MSKANILVVEDQDSIRHFVVKALEDEGTWCEVWAACARHEWPWSARCRTSRSST
jgi:CheY-like chemotaxis protein